MMKITVVGSTMVKPISATPCTATWLSILDLVNPQNLHVRTLYVYRPSAAASSDELKAAFGRALVDFYPLAGRLRKGTENNNHRIEIDCNGEGALFVEAESDAVLDDLGPYFTPRPDLIPHVDYSNGISAYPILLVQMTRFTCGGICLGIAAHHVVADGISAMNFMSTWSDLARGGGGLVPRPFLDRTIIRARDPPEPKFAHIEYNNIPNQLHKSNLSPQTKLSVFKLSRDQLSVLKTKCQKDDGTNYSTFEVLAAHIWRSISTARGLPENCETRLVVPIDGRSRLRPSLPLEYFGNAVFTAVPIASCGALVSNPMKYAAEKVHASLVRMDDKYLRSALDYLELQDGMKEQAGGESPCKSPNVGILIWAKLPMYDADFGWGRPVYVGHGVILPDEDGLAVVLQSPLNDGGLLCAISLVEEHMNNFEKFFYDI